MKTPNKGSGRKHINKADTKKRSWGIWYVLVFVLILMIGFGIQCLNDIHIHFNINRDDYTEIYKEQLDAIFGDDYEIGPRQTVSEYRKKGRNRYYDYYYTWEIRYRDHLGDEYTVKLTNDDPETWTFEEQVYYWMSEQAGEHFVRYCQKVDYSEEIYWEDIIYLDPSIPESSVILETFQNELLDSFKELDGLPHLYEMRYEDWFVTYPSYFYVGLKGDEISDEILNDILDDLREKTGGRFNLEISAGNDTKYYIMGEPRSFEKYFDYALALYQEYEKMGMFD